MRGGTRVGAGRRKGTPNKITAERRAAIAASGLTPLDYMLSILRDEKADERLRMEAAKSAAPYIHPRLTALDHSGGIEVAPQLEGPIEVRLIRPKEDADEPV